MACTIHTTVGPAPLSPEHAERIKALFPDGRLTIPADLEPTPDPDQNLVEEMMTYLMEPIDPDEWTSGGCWQ